MTDPAHMRANAPHRLGISLLAITLFAAGSSILPIGAAEHTVAPGEALSIIADEHAVSIDLARIARDDRARPGANPHAPHAADLFSAFSLDLAAEDDGVRLRARFERAPVSPATRHAAREEIR